MEYLITVFLEKDYSKHQSFIFKTDKSIIKFDDEGRVEITNEVNKRFSIWYYYDIEPYNF